MAAWFTWYMSGSLSRQAEQYGPIGVVFALFKAAVYFIDKVL
jgi:hypothetical protein